MEAEAVILPRCYRTASHYLRHTRISTDVWCREALGTSRNLMMLPWGFAPRPVDPGLAAEAAGLARGSHALFPRIPVGFRGCWPLLPRSGPKSKERPHYPSSSEPKRATLKS